MHFFCRNEHKMVMGEKHWAKWKVKSACARTEKEKCYDR